MPSSSVVCSATAPSSGSRSATRCRPSPTGWHRPSCSGRTSSAPTARPSSWATTSSTDPAWARGSPASPTSTGARSSPTGSPTRPATGSWSSTLPEGRCPWRRSQNTPGAATPSPACTSTTTTWWTSRAVWPPRRAGSTRSPTSNGTTWNRDGCASRSWQSCGEAGAAGAVQPSGPDHQGVGTQAPDRPLPRQLRPSVGRTRPRRGVLGVRAGGRAVEHVVGGDLDHPGAVGVCRPAEPGGTDGVDLEGGGLVRLGVVDGGPGGAVHHDVVAAHRGVGRIPIGDVELRVAGRGHLGTPAAQQLDEVTPEHAPGSRHQPTHACPFPAISGQRIPPLSLPIGEGGHMAHRELAVAGAWELTPRQFPDSRGVFLEWFAAVPFGEMAGHPLPLAQANLSVSAAGVLRGIHFSDVPPGQAKYVTCVRGAVLDVVVDVRVGSPTFGSWDAVLLDDVDRRTVYLSKAWATPSCPWRTARRWPTCARRATRPSGSTGCTRSTRRSGSSGRPPAGTGARSHPCCPTRTPPRPCSPPPSGPGCCRRWSRCERCWGLRRTDLRPPRLHGRLSGRDQRPSEAYRASLGR